MMNTHNSVVEPFFSMTSFASPGDRGMVPTEVGDKGPALAAQVLRPQVPRCGCRGGAKWRIPWWGKMADIWLGNHERVWISWEFCFCFLFFRRVEAF